LKIWQKLRLATVLLSLVSGGLIVLLIAIAHWGQARVYQPEHLADRHLAPPDLSALNPTAAPHIDLVAIRDNAVFYAHRTFFQPPPPGQSIPVPEYEFAGSMGLPQGKRLAFVKRKSDKSNRTVHVGDDLDGWRVEIIEATRVVLVRDEQKVELKAANESPGSGLVHGTVTPYVAQSGLRTIGDGTATPHPPQTVTHAARTYQPPPPRN
jgi:hypothetical protein